MNAKQKKKKKWKSTKEIASKGYIIEKKKAFTEKINTIIYRLN